MAVFQRKEEKERPQVSEHLPGVLLHGELLPGNWVSRSAVLLLLRRLLSFHPYVAPHRVCQLEQRRVGSGDHGQGAGKYLVWY